MNLNRRAFLKLSAALGASAGLYPVYGAARADGLEEKLDAVLRRAVDQGDVPLVVAAVTDRNATVYERAFGAQYDQGNSITVDTVFQIASMTKPITATAAMQLVEQGRLDLQSPISRWIPDAAKLMVLDWQDGSGSPRLRSPKREITLFDLLTHTSGFGYDMFNADLDRYMKANSVPHLGMGQEAAYYPPLMFDPGEQWEYGISTDWVGKLVEAVSGKALGLYMQENIFAPLGMVDTGYHLSDEMRDRLAPLHERDGNGDLTRVELPEPSTPVEETGGAGLNSTVGDYQRFMRMILNGGTGDGNRLLEPETVKMMSQNAIGDIDVTRLETTIPPFTRDAEFFPGLPKGWSLAFMVNEQTAPTGRPAGSMAWAGIFNTFFWIDPVTEIGGVYMTQVSPFFDEKSLANYYAFEEMVYQSVI